MQARFQQIKSVILDKISEGEMVPGDRVLSENQLAEQYQVSRMTARRALTELVAEGILARSQGLGTFVCDHRPMSSMLEIQSIQDEIKQRGHKYANVQLSKKIVLATEQQSVWLDVAPNSEIFHTQIVHLENGLPVQLEDRLVNPLWAPDYLKQNFDKTTANQYLNEVAPLTEADHIVEAIAPNEFLIKTLNIAATQPCLKISRRTYSTKGIVSYALLYHPGNRYRLGSHLEFNRIN
ncbi:histidine utilization repressor [Paraglaciecola sp.]|uniref:histidine utilization repressor n=1 Tax=Paraglaciecola sp. TaxID=1920173 RepID=UPI0030F45182